MQKHAVPQNIMDVEFKLFGSLTVKQFTYVAVSFIVALFFYISPFPIVLKYLFIFIAVATGLALTFLTVNGMPFAKWIGNFSYNLFSSQRKVYNKVPVAPRILAEGKFAGKKSLTGHGKAKDAQSNSYLEALLARNRQLNLANPGLEADRPIKAIDADDLLETERMAALDKYFAGATNNSLERYNIQDQGLGTAIPRPVNNSVEPSALDKSRSAGNMQAQNFPRDPNLLQPNQIAGFVVDYSNQPSSNAVVEIINSDNAVIESLTTDNTGKFIAKGGLTNGAYLVRIKKDGLAFADYQLDLSGQLTPLYRYMPKP